MTKREEDLWNLLNKSQKRTLTSLLKKLPKAYPKFGKMGPLKARAEIEEWFTKAIVDDVCILVDYILEDVDTSKPIKTITQKAATLLLLREKFSK